MKNFKLPSELGSDFENPSIIEIKEIKVVSNLNEERTFSDCCCEGHTCPHTPPFCQCVLDCGCFSNINPCNGH